MLCFAPSSAASFCLAGLMLVGAADGCGRPAAEPASKPAAAPKAVASQESLASWPLFRGDPQATGVVDGALPEQPELLWTFSTKDGGFEATAVIADGTVYAGSMGENLYAVDLATGKEKWKFFSSLGFPAPPAVREGRVYIGDSEGLFSCLDAATGQPVWQYQADLEIDSGANFHAGNVLFGSQDGNLYCLNAQTGAVVWKYESADQIRSFPVLAGPNVLVAGCDGRLHIVAVADGKAVGTVKLDGPTGCTPAVRGNLAWFGSEGGAFVAVDWQAAKIVWSDRDRRPSIRSSAAVTADLVVVGARDKKVHAFEPQTGRPLWTFTARGDVDSSPVVVGNRIYVGSSDGRIYALDRQTGQAMWQYTAGGHVLASPAVAAGRLVIGTTHGDLLCFGSRPDP